jgi:hypothetical protein
MTEKKLFQVVFLTLGMYGLISYFQLNSFVLPLPAFEIVVLGICFFLSFLSSKQDKLTSLLFVFFGITQFLAREYNFSFFLSDENLQVLNRTIWVDVFYILSALGLALLYIRQEISLKNKLIWAIVLGISLVITILSPFSWTVLIPLGFIVGRHQLTKKLFENQHSIWAYLLLFGICRELTLSFL